MVRLIFRITKTLASRIHMSTQGRRSSRSLHLSSTSAPSSCQGIAEGEIGKRRSGGRICSQEEEREGEGKRKRGMERQREDSSRLVIRASIVRRRNYGGTKVCMDECVNLHESEKEGEREWAKLEMGRSLMQFWCNHRVTSVLDDRSGFDTWDGRTALNVDLRDNSFWRGRLLFLKETYPSRYGLIPSRFELVVRTSRQRSQGTKTECWIYWSRAIKSFEFEWIESFEWNIIKWTF